MILFYNIEEADIPKGEENMSERSRIRADMRRRRKSQRNTQYIILGVIGLVVIGFILLMVFQPKNPPAAQSNATNPASQSRSCSQSPGTK